MDVSTLKQFLNQTHTYKGLDKLNVFPDNKMKNKPLKWWLQQMDEAPTSDEPFNITQFVTTYRILSQKKLRSSEYMNEVLDWAVNNKAKFRAGLQGSKMVQYRPNITKNEKMEQEREQEAAAEAEKTKEEKKAFRIIASFLNKTALTEYQQHVSDEIGHLLNSPDDFKNLPDMMKDVVEKWHSKKKASKPLSEYQQHVSDEIGHLLKEQDDFENLPEIMKDVVEKWHNKKKG